MKGILLPKTEEKLKKIEVNQLNNLDGFATRNYVINALKEELNKNREVENKNNVVGNWVLGYEGDLRNSIDLLGVFPIGLAWWTEGNKKTCLENGNLFLEVIYACKKIEEFNEAWIKNDLFKIQEVFIVLQEIRQGRGGLSEKALDFERWGARGTGETLRKRLDDVLTSEELQNLLTKQTELFHLEEHLIILQSEQQA